MRPVAILPPRSPPQGGAVPVLSERRRTPYSQGSRGPPFLPRRSNRRLPQLVYCEHNHCVPIVNHCQYQSGRTHLDAEAPGRCIVGDGRPRWRCRGCPPSRVAVSVRSRFAMADMAGQPRSDKFIVRPSQGEGAARPRHAGISDGSGRNTGIDHGVPPGIGRRLPAGGIRAIRDVAAVREGDVRPL